MDIATGFTLVKRRCIQDCTYGYHPRSSWQRYTIPQRDTVAGEATARSCTSKSMRNSYLNLIRSELARQRVMLSSSTVFMFSIHRASTGPSNTIHSFFFGSQVSSSYTVLTVRIIEEASPSTHSYVNGSTSPYSSPIETLLGLSI